MIRALDHLVIACPDPDAAATEVQAAVGLAFTGGGRHPRAGTRNRLAFLADGSYLELIGVSDASLSREDPIGSATIRTLDAGGGLATWALLEDDLEATCRERPALRGPVHGLRERADGERVEWWTAFPSAPLSPAMPFLIEHAYSGAEWGPEALRARAEYVHPIGSPVRLGRLDLAVSDPPDVAASLTSAFGIAPAVEPDLAVLTVGVHAVRLVGRVVMAGSAVVVMAADVESALAADLLGVRFLVEPLDRSA